MANKGRASGMRKEKIGDIVVIRVFFAVTLVFAAACLMPFVLMIISSFTDEAVLIREGYNMFPSKLSLGAYKAIFASQSVPDSYLTTVVYTLLGTLLSMMVTSMCSYAISGRILKYRNIIAFVFYFTMLFSGGLVPSYILISKILGMRNMIWVYILPILVNPWNMFMLRNFYNTLSESFRESALLDGAHEIVILFKIIIPLSAPSMATISLFYAVAYWNEWMIAMLYIDNEKLISLQYLIMRMMRNISAAKLIAQQSGVPIPMLPSETLRYATAMLSIGPIILLYPFLQRYFVSGLRVGGIKG